MKGIGFTVRTAVPRWLGAAALMVLGWSAAMPAAQAAAVTTYGMSGTCLVGCDAAGATNGDAASATVSGGFVNLNLGSDAGGGDPAIINTADPFAEPSGLNNGGGSYEFTGTSDGTNISTLQIIVNSANLFSFNAGTGIWNLSLSAGGFSDGTGTFTRRAAPENGLFVYDFAGNCVNNCGDFGQTDGDPVSGELSFGQVTMGIGTAGVLFETMDPAADGIVLSGTSNGTLFSALSIVNGANFFGMPAPPSNDWQLSPSLPPCEPNCQQPFAVGDWTTQTSQTVGDVVGGTPIPAPGTLAVLTVGLAGLAFTRRRRVA